MRTSYLLGFVLGMASLCILYTATHRQQFVDKMIPLSVKAKNGIWKLYNNAGRNLEEEKINHTETPLKRIVLWNGFFSRDDWYIPFPKGRREKEIKCFDRSRCILSINRTDPLSYDAVVFHARNHHTPPRNRAAQQIYIMYVWESPAYRSNDFVRGGHFYNWTSTYSTKSDITMKHGQWFTLPEKQPDALKTLPQLIHQRQKGKAMVLWIISHCGGVSNRFKYANELKKHIKVDIYGGCGKPCPKGTAGNSGTCYNKMSATGQYKFYLAFENSACHDYISLKPYRALNNSLVPVVLGGTSTKDYVGLFPPNSYIDVRNYTSPKALADYLKFLDQHNDQYLAYLAWRTDYWVNARFGPTFCQICDAIYNKTMTKPRNVNWGEFWNSGKKCDSHLVGKLLSGNYKENL